MRSFLKLSSTLLFIAFAFKGVYAQEDGSGNKPSEAELEEYVEVDLALQAVRRERKEKVMEAIGDSELGVRGYRKAASKESDPDKELSEEKKAALKEVRKDVKGIQKEYRKKEKEKIQEMGMSSSRYKEIGEMVEEEGKLRKRMIRIKEKKMEEAQKGG